jgi:hypothetical protein
MTPPPETPLSPDEQRRRAIADDCRRQTDKAMIGGYTRNRPSETPREVERFINVGLQDALNRMKRASNRGTGCYLTAEMVAGLGLTFIAEAWEEDDPRDLIEGDAK